jgi:CheY-like chemotaxis protein
VVEDEAEVRHVLVEALGSLGYGVLESADGVEALEVLRARTVDLVITDVVMPRLGGGELWQAARSLAPGVAFLFSSGYSEGVLLDGVAGVGPVNFIAKPYGIDELDRAVRRLLDAGERAAAAAATAPAGPERDDPPAEGSTR